MQTETKGTLAEMFIEALDIRSSVFTKKDEDYAINLKYLALTQASLENLKML